MPISFQVLGQDDEYRKCSRGKERIGKYCTFLNIVLTQNIDHLVYLGKKEGGGEKNRPSKSITVV